MQISGFSRFTSDDFRNVPAWFKAVIVILNPLIDTLNQLLQNGIDLRYNIQAEQQTINIVGGTATQVYLQTLTLAPHNVRAGNAGSTEEVSMVNIIGYDNTGINPIVVVRFQSGTTSAIPVLLTFEP